MCTESDRILAQVSSRPPPLPLAPAPTPAAAAHNFRSRPRPLAGVLATSYGCGSPNAPIRTRGAAKEQDAMDEGRRGGRGGRSACAWDCEVVVASVNREQWVATSKSVYAWRQAARISTANVFVEVTLKCKPPSQACGMLERLRFGKEPEDQNPTASKKKKALVNEEPPFPRDDAPLARQEMM